MDTLARPSLAPGSNVIIRPVDAADTEGLRAFYDGLSAESRRARFLGSAAHVSERQCRSFCTTDHEHREGFVAVLDQPGPADGPIIGHVCVEPDAEARIAEVAVAVADAYQRRGIGRALVTAAVAWARERSFEELTATMFATNAPILGLLRSIPFRGRVRCADAGILELRIPLAPAPVVRRGAPVFVEPSRQQLSAS